MKQATLPDSPASSTPTLRVRCVCGKIGEIPASFRDRKVRCRACGQLSALPRQPGERFSLQRVRPAAWRATQTAPAARDSDASLFAQSIALAEQIEVLPSASRTRWTRYPLPAARKPIRYLKQEQHARALALWWLLAGVLCGLGTLAASVVSLGLSVALAFALLLGGLALSGGLLASGVGLWRYQSWARWIVVACCALGILCAAGCFLLAPSGLGFLLVSGSIVLNGFTISALAGGRGTRLFTPAYRAQVAESNQGWVSFWWSPFFYLPVGLGVLTGVGLLVSLAGTLIALAQAL